MDGGGSDAHVCQDGGGAGDHTGRQPRCLLVVVDPILFLSSRRLHTIYWRDWSSDVCSSDLRVPRNWGANVTLLASMSVGGMGPCLAVEGPTTKAVFEAYLGRVLAPSLRPSQVVVMDNLSSHKGSRMRELVEARGCELVYLPAYSPDLNPIEEAFAKLKALLRKAEARTRETLIEALGKALEAVTANDARGFFEHRGYHATAQLL